jgi:integrase
VARQSARTSFGSIRELPSGRYQVRYFGTDGVRHTAPITFDTKGDAATWLATARTDIVRGHWAPPQKRADTTTFGDYAAGWLAERELKPRTRVHYRALLDRQLLPTFEDMAVSSITPAVVRIWHTEVGKSRPTLRSHAYGLLRAILGTAVSDQLIGMNPCQIRGGGTSKRVVKIKPASLSELEALTIEMPAKYQMAVLLAAWCGLRFGELTEQRRKDVDLPSGTLHVTRAVAWVHSRPVVGTPKSDAGVRDVAIPPHLLPALKAHVAEHAARGKDGLLFPSPAGTHLTTSTLYRSFWRARRLAGRPDLRWHDLRHTGAVLAASTGATLAELMSRLGHSTPGAALRYQHVAEGRDALIAIALSELATGRPQ